MKSYSDIYYPPSRKSAAFAFAIKRNLAYRLTPGTDLIGGFLATHAFETGRRCETVEDLRDVKWQLGDALTQRFPVLDRTRIDHAITDGINRANAMRRQVITPSQRDIDLRNGGDA